MASRSVSSPRPLDRKPVAASRASAPDRQNSNTAQGVALGAGAAFFFVSGFSIFRSMVGKGGSPSVGFLGRKLGPAASR
jgi:hypothetical protein